MFTRKVASMNLRSWLFIPGDSDKKLAKADGAGADALILDLEDSVAAPNKAAARAKVRAFLDQRSPGARESRGHSRAGRAYFMMQERRTGFSLSDFCRDKRDKNDCASTNPRQAEACPT